MREYGFSLTRIFPNKDRIVDTILIRENTAQRKPAFRLAITCSKLAIETLEQDVKYVQN